MRGDPQHDHAVVAEADRLTVLPVDQNVVCEGRVDDLALGAEQPAAVAREGLHGRERKAQLARDRVELAQRRKRLIGKLLRALVEDRLRLVALVLGFEFRPYFLERTLTRGAYVLETDDVISEARPDRSADLALLHREERIGERRLVGLACRPAEIAALRLRADVVRILASELGEIRTTLRLFEQRLRARARCGIVLAAL